MRDVFPEYFVNKNIIDFNKLDKSVLVVLDTNILLDFYRGSKKLRGELKKSLQKVSNNLWLPYQVGFEFNRNRKLIIHGLAKERQYFSENLSNKLLDAIKEDTKIFSNKNILFEELIEENNVEFKKINEVIESSLKTISENFNSSDAEDQLSFIEDIFSGKIANNDTYAYNDWEKEAKERYEIKRPPGYEDLKQKKEEYYFIKGERVCAAYGDYFLWKELLLKAKEDKIKEVVFVTKDIKEDWFYETKGMKIGARVELIEEMLKESDAKFRIYTSSSFLFKTSDEADYKMIEQEVVKSEKTSFSESTSQYKKYNNFMNRFNSSDMIFNDEIIYKNSVIGRNHENLNSLVIEISDIRFEIEEKLRLAKTLPYDQKKAYMISNLEARFYRFLEHFERMINSIINSPDLIQDVQSVKSMELLHSAIKNINSDISDLLKES